MSHRKRIVRPVPVMKLEQHVQQLALSRAIHGGWLVGLWRGY